MRSITGSSGTLLVQTLSEFWGRPGWQWFSHGPGWLGCVGKRQQRLLPKEEDLERGHAKGKMG